MHCLQPLIAVLCHLQETAATSFTLHIPQALKHTAASQEQQYRKQYSFVLDVGIKHLQTLRRLCS